MDLSQESIEKIVVGVVTAIVILILSEPIKAGFRKIGEWLDGFFQAVGFGVTKRYFAALTVNRENLKLIGAYEDREKPPKLENVYISLKLDSETDSHADDWTKVFRTPKRQIAIKGMPGAGKTTLLDYLILIFTGSIKHALPKELGNPLPIYVRLRTLKQKQLKEFIGTREHCEEEIHYGYFEKRLERGKCIVLFDGLDEVLDEKDKEHAVRQIQMFARKYADNWMIVTSRPMGWSKQFFPDFDEYDIQDLSDDAVRKFIGDWYRVVKAAEANKNLPEKPSLDQLRLTREAALRSASNEAEKLWTALSKNQGLLKVARRPLILVLIALVYKYQHSLPRGRAELYEECLKILLSIWDKRRDIDSPLNALAYEDKKSILMAIAFEFLKRNLLQMNIADLCGLIAPLLSKRNLPMSAEEFVRQISSRSGILVDFGVYQYGFAHRALQDRLAADQIVDEKFTDLLLEHADSAEWREVILIAVRLVTKDLRENLLKALLAHADTSAASLAMAGWSLAEGIQVEPALRLQVTNTLTAHLDRAQTTSDFAVLSSALSDADPQAMQSWVGSVLSGNNPDLQKRVLASLIPDLGLEQSKPFLPNLTSALADPHADANLRAQCALVLAKLKPSPDADLWNALTSARKQADERLKAAAVWAYCELGRGEELGLLSIPAGEFLMGSSDADKRKYDEEQPQHTLYLPNYYIAKYPVTVDEYRAFVQESGYKTSDERSLGGVENHPVVYVTWNDALAFAKWKGVSLPSEAEWEKAARGTDGRIYPWGNDWKDGYANTDEYWQKPQSFWDRIRRKNGKRATTPVGTFSPRGDSPYGCADMSGNVWEWTRSVYKEYPYNASDGREDEKASGFRVLRGGSFLSNQRSTRCAFRDWYSPDHFNYFIGFRVCASPIITSEI
ncbi:MAG: SUMF1/EgtB/PvdO family nonheme iron enzyme [Anaerolineales bacterium]|nr:SUMF1/EgtB/PvdO family nonheme iron enzyme [Anaerolineales bacterium]